jgi:hypothetical protein
MALKVIDTFWFSNRDGTYGMVITENEVGVKKARIGIVAGVDQKKDADYLAAWGGRVVKDAVIEFLKKADR